MIPLLNIENIIIVAPSTENPSSIKVSGRVLGSKSKFYIIKTIETTKQDGTPNKKIQ